MMGYGNPMGWAGGYGNSLGVLSQIVWLIAGILLAVWLWKQIQKA